MKRVRKGQEKYIKRYSKKWGIKEIRGRDCQEHTRG